MKTRVILIFTFLICFLFQDVVTLGQDSIRATIKLKHLTLKGTSGEQEVLLPLRDSLSYINFDIRAVITSGELTIELYDPMGEKYGNFSLAGSASSKNKQNPGLIRGKTYVVEASGSLVRHVQLPQRGMWKAKVFTKNAAGGVDFYLTREVTVIKIN